MMTILLLAAMQATAYVSRVSGFFTTAYARLRKRFRPRPRWGEYTLETLPPLAGGAASAAISTRTRGQAASRIPYPVNALSQIWKGSLVAVDSTGHAVAATDSASDIYIVGVAESSVLGGASDGDKWITVLSAGVFEFAATSITQAMLGSVMYCVDDETIDDAAGATNDVPVGVLVEYVSTTKGWVSIPLGGMRADADSVGTADIVAGAVTSSKVEAGLVRYIDTQLTASNVNNLVATNIELVPTPGANLAVFPVAIHLVLVDGGTDFVQDGDDDQLALRYNASNEIMEIGSEAQCKAFLESVGADAYLFDPCDMVGFVPEANKAIDLDNNGDAEYATGDGTLSVRVYYVTVPMVAFS